MGWVQAVTAVVTLIVKVVDIFLDRSKERKKLKKEALHEATKALKGRDASGFTRAITRLNGVR